MTSPSFLGMHMYEPDSNAMPPFPVSITRLWYTQWGGNRLYWSAVETASGVYNWTYLDAAVAFFNNLNIPIIYDFGIVPGWANGNASSATPPTNYSDLQNFVTAVVTRYKGKIAYYSCFNEMGNNYWNSSVTTMAAQDIAFCAWMYPAIKAIDPAAFVTTPCFNGFYMQPLADSYFSALGNTACDFVNVHAYPISTIWGTIQEQVLYQWNLVANTMAGYKITKPLIVSEGSWDAANGVNFSYYLNTTAKWPLICAGIGAIASLWFQFDSPASGGSYLGRLLNSDGKVLNSQGRAFIESHKWLMGTTITSSLARIALSNEVRNPNSTGVVAGSPGTLPTDWTTNISVTGLTRQIIGVQTINGVTGVVIRFYGTPTNTASYQIFFETNTQMPCVYNTLSYGSFYLSLTAGSLAGTTGFQFISNTYTSAGAYQASNTSLHFIPYLGNPQLIEHTWINAGAAGTIVNTGFAIGFTSGVPVDITIFVGLPAVDNGTVFSETVTKPDGTTGQIIWDASGSSSYSTSYGYYRDYTGVSRSIVGGAVPLTTQPIFLETTAYKALL